MPKIIMAAVAASFLVHSTVLAVGARAAMYVGGTAVALQERMEGTLSTSAEDQVVFTVAKKPNPRLEISYATITSLEYGQKAGRRVAVGVLVSPFALFSKKRNHFLTIGYTDAQGKEQAAVFELGKDIVRTTLKVLEVRSGKTIEYQDEEARKSGVGGK